MDTIIDRYPDSNLKILTDHLARLDNPSVTDFINELASMYLEYPEWSDNRLELTQLQAASQLPSLGTIYTTTRGILVIYIV